MTSFALLLSGCSSLERMPPTPHINCDGSGSTRLREVDPSLQRPEIEILYVTDRVKEREGRRGPEYGFGRALQVEFGTATVSLTPTPTWEQVVEWSGQGDHHPDWSLELTQVEAKGSVVITGQDLEVVDGTLRRKPEAQEVFDAARAAFAADLASKLESARSKDVYLYVHGFNNTFYDAIARSAILWHSISRQGVFIAYTWPAGSGGLRGYFYDRESGEFTVYHLRELIRLIAEVPEVERLHIIAHSRGTDIATTALRELNIQFRAQGLDPQQALKLETIMLAAPDLDLDIFTQRFWLENLGPAARRAVIYFSGEDDAIGLSNWLFKSRTRIGTLSEVGLTPQASSLLQQLKSIQLIECQVSGFGSSHAYVFGNPAAMSDVVAVLRDRSDIGAEHGRPLQQLEDGTWLLTNSYLADRKERASATGDREETSGPADADRSP